MTNDVLWHPFTQMRGWQHEEPVLIESAQGTTLVDTEGREYIDGISSLWCNVHGHRHPHIDQAVRDQLDRVAHSTMLGLSHPGAVELGRKLLDIAPEGLSRVFYSDNGSTACEIALKMAFQYWQHMGEHARTKFVYLRNSYHGDTVGSVSVGGIELFHHMYEPLLFEGFAVEPGDVDGLRHLLDEHR
ncbi:MAG: adenosylmethionine-8-amino-7-oxononanoate aminotransferase apoenzyme, partial [Solirubrobacterales bacterium]|nr:adenosylmethionine-8-amino-7-oxononanoate aminotransferase apoenzyme [Solirubrobacterales bacterium]